MTLVKTESEPLESRGLQKQGRNPVFSTVVLLCSVTSDRMNMLYLAHREGMTGPDWVYIYWTLLPSSTIFEPWTFDAVNLTEDAMNRRKQALLSFKQVRAFRGPSRGLKSVTPPHFSCGGSWSPETLDPVTCPSISNLVFLTNPTYLQL